MMEAAYHRAGILMLGILAALWAVFGGTAAYFTSEAFAISWLVETVRASRHRREGWALFYLCLFNFIFMMGYVVSHNI